MRNDLTCLLLAFCLISCGKSNSVAPSTPPDAPDVIARVDDHVLRVGDLRALDPAGTLTAEEIQQITESWIERELLMKVATERGVTDDTVVRWHVEEKRAEVVLSSLGSSLRSEIGSETEAKLLLRREIDAMKKKSRVESNPWRVK